MNLYEWQRVPHHLDPSKLKGFNEYLRGAWENRLRYAGDESADDRLQDQTNQRFFDFTFDGDIIARNFVGVVQFEGVRITVAPKIFEGREDINSWKYHLMYWLSYCRRIEFPFTFANMDDVYFEDVLELMIYIFAHFTQDLIVAQPYQAYHQVTEESSYLRGSLNFEAYTQNNLITGKWQHFTCEYQPFMMDNKFNQIIRFVANKLSKITRNNRNLLKLEEIVFHLDGVTDCSCQASDCDQVKLNNLYTDHVHVLNLCKMYLSNQMIDTNDNDSSNFCFLVPMEYVFEDFVFSFLKSNFPKIDFRRQSPGYLASRGEEEVFIIKNDIYIPNKLVIDTKYTFRSNDDGPKAGVSQSHMYQMLAYGLRRNCEKVLLIYPFFSSSLADVAVFKISSKLLLDDIEIVATTVDIIVGDLKNIEAILHERMKRMLFIDSGISLG